MESTMELRRKERRASCFRRAARRIRRVLSRICRDSSPSPVGHCNTRRTFNEENCLEGSSAYFPILGTKRPTSCSYYESSVHLDSSFVFNDLDLYATRRPNSRCQDKYTNMHVSWNPPDTAKSLHVPKFAPAQLPVIRGVSLPHQSHHRNRSTTDMNDSTDRIGSWYRAITATLSSGSRAVRQYQSGPQTVCTEGSGVQDAFEQLSVQSESVSAGDSDSLVKMEALVTAVISSVTNTQPTRPHLQLSSDPGWSQRGSSCLPRSHSVPSLSQRSCAENQTFRPSQSLPDMLLKSSFEEFTPDITVDEDDESYRFLCSCPGLYQCSVTGLVFHMEGEGDVVYRIVSWDRRLLAQHHKKPAGPLFDIKCQQKSVCRLHLPHCEIPSTAGCQFLSVAHLNDEGIEFIAPHKVTDTHVIINISGFSGYGNIKDDDSPCFPVQALVLLFYRPAYDPDLESLLNVLILPGNVSVRDVRRTRKSLVGDELYIETSSHCKLLPGQEYTLSTCPEDDSVLVQPTTAEFDSDNYDNYIPSFQVDLEKILKHIKLFLRDTNRHSVWERRVCLSSAGLTKSCGQSALNLPSHQKLFDIRSSFIEGISGPVLKSLLDKLFEKKVLIDSERESVDEMQNRGDKARLVIDTVRRKGEAASSEMIEFLCELDPFLCEHLGLI
ncbi:NACHT, LRR and PYD domains-containing protein 1b allele 3-like [Acanthopagrus latus]|uniref:NACHT, LRR and PYD domains-containing protein 1b allele 3-like n=1 Tax=Acanthopagrus latus TaxID=8177 RepID=UPI00187CF8D6|nr:NACHT, LRR and PYD domains-containing protein 1b allele 3-like [Acanthopagrus latus]